MNHNECHKQIEDIIDARNESGQYDILCNGIKQNSALQQGNSRYAYSTPTNSILDDNRDDECNRNIEGDTSDLRYLDMNNNNGSIGPTDSEITLIRVKRESSHWKRPKVNNWEVMHDSAIPGDGSHLGESPSLVNLVTFVVPHPTSQKALGECNEYMVPLSSWEPTNAATIPEDLQEENESDSAVALAKTQSASSSTPWTGTQKRSQQSLVGSSMSNKSVEKQRSVKDLFKCMVFWKRKPSEHDQTDCYDAEQSHERQN